MEPMLTDNPNEFLSSAGADQDPLVSVVCIICPNLDAPAVNTAIKLILWVEKQCFCSYHK